jgi:Family of unknown function (DUF6221)
VDDFTAWLRQRIQARLALAQGTIELGNNAVWREQSSGVLVTGDSGSMETVWDGTWPMGDSTLTRLMEANDPRDTIARCEAELAILDEHYILTNDDRSPDYEEFSVVPWGAKGGAGDQGCGCVACHYYAQGGVKGYGICRTVRLLGSAYKHQPGYREEWAPAGGVHPSEISASRVSS